MIAPGETIGMTRPAGTGTRTATTITPPIFGGKIGTTLALHRTTVPDEACKITYWLLT